jgi:hypothetical protein
MILSPSSQGILGNVLRHFLVVTTRKCYEHHWIKIKDAATYPTVHSKPPQQYNRGLSRSTEQERKARCWNVPRESERTSNHESIAKPRLPTCIPLCLINVVKKKATEGQFRLGKAFQTYPHVL